MSSPISGRVTVDGNTQSLGVDRSIVFTGVNQPFGLTFTNDELRMSLVDVEGDSIDLAAVFNASDGIPGGLKTITLRPQPIQPNGMVVIIDGRRYEGTKNGTLWTFDVPANRKSRVITFWENVDGTPHLSLKEIESANDLEGSAVAIAPNLALEANVPIQVTGLPQGWLTAELVYNRVRTGIRIAEGLVSPRRARSIPSNAKGNDYELSLWIEVSGKTGLAPESTASIEVSLPFYRQSAALDWPLKPSVSPTLRDVEDEVELLEEDGAIIWGESAAEADWLDLNIHGLGRCTDLSWRVLGPPDALETLPELDAGDPRQAPLLRVSATAVNRVGWSWKQFLSWGALGLDRPEFITMEARRSLIGYWVPESGQCEDEHKLKGRYTLFPSGPCSISEPKPVYWVSRCGDQIELIGAPDVAPVCGRFKDGEFRVLGGDRISVDTLDKGRVRVGGNDGYHLVPISRTDTVVPEFLIGAWMSYETTEFDVQVMEGVEPVRLNMPVRIAVGDPEGGPWMEVASDGRVRLTTRFLQFSGHVIRVGEGIGIALDGTGCLNVRRVLILEQEDSEVVLSELLPSDEAGVNHQRRYRFRR